MDNSPPVIDVSIHIIADRIAGSTLSTNNMPDTEIRDCNSTKYVRNSRSFVSQLSANNPSLLHILVYRACSVSE